LLRTELPVNSVNSSTRSTVHNMYKPLPEFITIQNSPIHGLGLFATQTIDEGTVLGITHLKDNRFEDGYIRTPLGGFFNHSDNPNCECYKDGDFLKLKTIRTIHSDEEITVKYWLYEI